jgi:hypothetical protein
MGATSKSSATSTETSSHEKVDDDIERLRKLKDMYEQGLINESEYAAEKQKTLDGL